MQAVVLAAGEGTRMRPLTEDRPKGLVSVGGKSVLTHCFERLADLGADELVVVVGYLGDSIVDRYGDSFDGVPITYARQRERKGLAHALLAAEDHLDGDFLVMNGDNLFRANLGAVADRHRSGGTDATLLVESVSREAARETGVFELDGDGRPVGVVEKPDDPPSTLVTTGFFAFSTAALHACHLVTPSERGEYELADAIDLLLYAGRPVETVPLEGWRMNLNTPADVEAAERRLRGDAGRR